MYIFAGGGGGGGGGLRRLFAELLFLVLHLAILYIVNHELHLPKSLLTKHYRGARTTAVFKQHQINPLATNP